MPAADTSPEPIPPSGVASSPGASSLDAAFARWFESRRAPILILAALFALFWTLILLQFTVDDAWISFRYAKTLLAHHTWNWNPTGIPIGIREEAYTSALYTALAILPASLHLPPALFFKILGLACIAAILLRLRAAASPFAALLGVALLAVHPWVWLHAYSGLETPLYMLLLLEMALAADRPQTTSPAWVYTLFLLLPLTRPEGLVFACLGVVLFWRARGRISASGNLLQFAAVLTLGLLYFLARWHYFGHLFPNPFYSKLAPTSWAGLRDGLLFNLSQSKGYFLTLLLVALLARRLSTRVFALTGLLILALFATHGMQMNYADRFYFQVTLPILLFFLIAEDLVPIARTAAIVVLVFLTAASIGDLRREVRYFPYLQKSNLDLGRRLAAFAPNHTLFTGDAGAIPYYSNWVAYDPFGLATYRIARDGVTLPLMQQLHPDLILIEAEEPGPAVLQQLASPGEGSVWTVPLTYIRRSGEYDYIADSDFNGEYLVEFLRKDTPQYAEIAAALRRNAAISTGIHLSLKDLLLQRYVPWTDKSDKSDK